jgi:lantibiotic biosynthesis protein
MAVAHGRAFNKNKQHALSPRINRSVREVVITSLIFTLLSYIYCIKRIVKSKYILYIQVMKDKIEHKLKEIYHVLKEHNAPYHALYTDTGGKLLFLYEYAKYTNDTEVIKHFEATLTELAENMNQTNSTTFCSGFAGNMWLLEYFKNEGIIDDLLLEIGADLNVYIKNWGQEFINAKNYDFLHGLLGIIYAGNYCKVVDKTVIKELTDGMLKDLISENEISYFTDWMPNKEEDPEHEEKINLGLAHGIPSAMVTLALLKDLGPSYVKAAEGIAEFIIDTKKKNPKDSLYCSVLYDRKDDSINSRLGWCYGDLGIALTLWQTGKLLQKQKYQDEALAIMNHANNRKDLNINAIRDCGLCHGSAGVAHIFNRFYWETGDKAFKSTADYWTQVTLDMATHNDEGLAGYAAYRAVGDTPWILEYGLLEGIGGIGLALLGSLNNESVSWDQCMMISNN